MNFVPLLLSVAPKATFQIQGEAPGLVARVWQGLGLWGRIAVIAIASLIVIWALVALLRKIGQRGRHQLLIALTLLSCAGFVGLSAWSHYLPDKGGGYFELWHQFVRVGGALCAMAFVACVMILATPVLLDRTEGRGFVMFVAARHVRASKSGFLTVISILSIAGVFVSSFALCSVVSIMGGFGADLKRKILGNNAHVRVEAKTGAGFQHWRELLDDVRKIPNVQGASAVTGGEAMASSSTNTAGVLLRGIDTATIGNVIDLEKNIEIGKFGYLDKPEKLAELPADEPIGIGPTGELYLKGPDYRSAKAALDPAVAEAIMPDDIYPGIVLGRELAKTLHVYVGDEVTLVSPLGDLGPMGVLPRSRKFRVAAIFYSGMYEYDASHAYVKIDVAQKFLDYDGQITAIDIKVADAERVEQVRPGLEALLTSRPDLRIRDWKELNRNLFSALKLEKIATFFILCLAILVASFCIICTLLLMVTEKSKEIAILKALGASDRAILKVFMAEGMMIGGIGTIFGVITGYVVAEGLRRLGVKLDPEVYYIDRLPISVDPVDYLIVAICALLITTLATLYPAIAASRLRPVDGIRYE
ncbi:MAG TPA: ABC transporter permease [Polyangiaceae bacterium]|nr:ABC transporter permease [Polyangiaceae bacterium]